MYLTVGDLKKALKKVPDDAPIRYERIENFYCKTDKDKCVKNSVFRFEDPFDEYVEEVQLIFIEMIKFLY